LSASVDVPPENPAEDALSSRGVGAVAVTQPEVAARGFAWPGYFIFSRSGLVWVWTLFGSGTHALRLSLHPTKTCWSYALWALIVRSCTSQPGSPSRRLAELPSHAPRMMPDKDAPVLNPPFPNRACSLLSHFRLARPSLRRLKGLTLRSRGTSPRHRQMMN